MTTRVYATLADYRAYSLDVVTGDARVNFLLPRASAVLDIALVGAVYPTDPQGYPTDAGLIDVLMKAVCEQVMFIRDQDDDTGVKARLDNVRVGSLSFTRAKGTSGMALPALAPMALTLLRTAGVLPTAPMINW